MTESKQGEGVSLDTIVFADQRNLVFVDEGHQGQKSAESVWKRIQRNIAGVGHPQAGYRGLLIEFSATFGQVAEAEHAFDRYAKSVLYDYAYDRFHADLYGKDFDVRNLQGASGWKSPGSRSPRQAPPAPSAPRWIFRRRTGCGRGGRRGAWGLPEC